MKYSQADIDKARRDFAFTLKPWVDGSPHGSITEGSDWYSMIILNFMCIACRSF